MKLLHIDSSALGSHSVSRALTADIVAQFSQARPDTRVHYRDLAAQPLPHWTPVTDAIEPAALLGSEVMDEFLAADVIVVGAPMYNFGVTSQLKAWIDRIAVAGKTFHYTANGPEGLAGGKRMIVASSRGGFYGKDSAGAAMDFQETYLRAVFGFLGITDVEFVRAEGVAVSAAHKEQALSAAREAISSLLPKAA